MLYIGMFYQVLSSISELNLRSPYFTYPQICLETLQWSLPLKDIIYLGWWRCIGGDGGYIGLILLSEAHQSPNVFCFSDFNNYF